MNWNQVNLICDRGGYKAKKKHAHPNAHLGPGAGLKNINNKKQEKSAHQSYAPTVFFTSVTFRTVALPQTPI